MRKTSCLLALLLTTLLATTALAWAQQATPNMTPIDQPPKVGDVAPDFTLPSGSKLTPMKLSDMRGTKKVLLAFYVFDFTGG